MLPVSDNLWSVISGSAACLSGPVAVHVYFDYRLSEKRSISADELYSTMCEKWTVEHFGLALTKSIHFWWRYAREKNDIYLYFPNVFDVWP